MIRSFVAISIPDPILEAIEQTVSRIRALGLNARFPKIRSIHLTLKFLGDLDPSMVGDVSRALDAVVQSHETFELTIQGTGVFPNIRRPRIVWVGVDVTPALLRLQSSVEESMVRLGFESDRRPYRPHLTVARLKDARNLLELRDFLEEEAVGLTMGSLRVDEVLLMQSTLWPQGAEYQQLSSHSLSSS